VSDVCWGGGWCGYGVYCLFWGGFGGALVVRGLVEVLCFLAVDTRIGCTRLYGLLTCVGRVLRVRGRGRYVYVVMGYVGGRGLRAGTEGRGGAFWGVCVWVGVGIWALCLGIWL
jgi:hypothetical protein